MRCYVPGCSNVYKPGESKGISFHLWTRLPDQRLEWMKVLGMNYVPVGDARICSEHFDDPADFCYYTKNNINKRRIDVSAVPKRKLGPRMCTVPDGLLPNDVPLVHSDDLHPKIQHNEDHSSELQSPENTIESSLDYTYETIDIKPATLQEPTLQTKLNDRKKDFDVDLSKITCVELDMCRICSKKTDSNCSPLFEEGVVTLAGQQLSRLIQVDVRRAIIFKYIRNLPSKYTRSQNPLQVQPADGLPEQICPNCLNTLKQFMKFQQSATEMHFKFVSITPSKRSDYDDDSFDDGDDDDDDW